MKGRVLNISANYKMFSYKQTKKYLINYLLDHCMFTAIFEFLNNA